MDRLFRPILRVSESQCILWQFILHDVIVKP
jgi:hypothetical protein